MQDLLYAMLFVCAVSLLAAAFVVLNLLSKRTHLERTLKSLSARVKLLDQEVAEARESESVLREKEARYNYLFKNTRDMVFMYSLDDDGLPGTFLEVNDIVCEQLGYGRDDFSTLTLLDVQDFEKPSGTLGYSSSDLAVLSDDYVHDREKKVSSRAARRFIERILKEGDVHYEAAFRHSGGALVHVEVDARRCELGGRQMVMCTARNIEERLKAAKALQDSQQRFSGFFSQSPIGIAIYDADRNLVDVNLACLRMFGTPDQQQFSQLNLFEGSFIPRDARNRLMKGESAGYEAIIDFQEILKKSVFATTRTGTAYFDVLITGMGFDETFRSKGYFAQIQDTTERRKAEESLKQNEQHLRQAEKMEALGSMAGGIAHDFNNILTPIIGYAQMMTRKYPEAAEPHESAKKIFRAANRAKDLVAQILAFSRKADEREKLQTIHVVPIAKEVLKMQASVLPPGMEISRILKAEQDTVVANPVKIHQVLMNICTNAVYAMKKKGGVLELSTSNFVVTKRSGHETSDLAPGSYIGISIRDTGSGMDQATLKRIFDPFFTTKPSGEGTGMGLAVVHGIIKSMKGGIAVESEPGKGTVFHVSLPIVETAVVEEVGGAVAAPLPTGTECVLVVDDDAEVLDTTSDMLKSLGYTTVGARGGQEGHNIFRASPGKFHLVITDQVMPGVSGTELTKTILTIRRDIPIILCTGFSNTITPAEATQAGVKKYLVKPVAIEDLAAAVRTVLDAAKKMPGRV